MAYFNGKRNNFEEIAVLINPLNLQKFVWLKFKIIYFQGHIGENPFDSGVGWSKNHFTTTPWPPSFRQSRYSVSNKTYYNLFINNNIPI